MTTFFSFLLAATSHQVFQGNAAMSTIELLHFPLARRVADQPTPHCIESLRQCGDGLRQPFQGKAAMIFFEGMGRN
jgi:hypothetical protein